LVVSRQAFPGITKLNEREKKYQILPSIGDFNRLLSRNIFQTVIEREAKNRNCITNESFLSFHANLYLRT
jgi:hypothetical protein